MGLHTRTHLYFTQSPGTPRLPDWGSPPRQTPVTSLTGPWTRSEQHRTPWVLLPGADSTSDPLARAICLFPVACLFTQSLARTDLSSPRRLWAYSTLCPGHISFTLFTSCLTPSCTLSGICPFSFLPRPPPLWSPGSWYLFASTDCL